jgi:hypothetical protein
VVFSCSEPALVVCAKILTLTISAFDPESRIGTSMTTAGDYSAVFPLLVVAVFVSLMAARDTVVYSTQRSRGDITAVPEVLCRPGMEGSPMVVDYDNCLSETSGDESEPATGGGDDSKSHLPEAREETMKEAELENSSPLFRDASTTGQPSLRFDEILGATGARQESLPKTHRRSTSAPSESHFDLKGSSLKRTQDQNDGGRIRTSSSGSPKTLLVRVPSYGDVRDNQPSLLEQARHRSASSTVAASKHRRIPSLPLDPKEPRRSRHNRSSSLTSTATASIIGLEEHSSKLGI